MKTEIGAPFLSEQVADGLERGFRSEIVTKQSAVKTILSGGHVARFAESGKTVDEIPVDYAFHGGMAEPEAVNIPDDLRLDLLVFRIIGIRGNGEFGNLERPVECGVNIQQGTDPLRIVRNRCLLQFLFLVKHHVILHTDAVDPGTFHHRPFDLHVIRAAVPMEPAVVPHACLVDDQLVRGEILFGGRETPFHQILLN